MFRSMSFSGKIGLSFVAVACLSLLVGGLSIYGLQSIVAEKDRIIEINVQNLVNAVRLQSEALSEIIGMLEGSTGSRDTDGAAGEMRDVVEA